MFTLFKSATSVFKSTPKKTFADLLKVDIGSHVIPDFGYNSPDIYTSLHLLEKMSELGYKKVIATPNISTPESNQDLVTGAKSLNKELKINGIKIEVEAAPEYLLNSNFDKLLKTGKVLGFGQKNYVLVKMPFEHSTPYISQVVFNLLVNGFTPVLAHPERYTYWHHNYSVFPRLQELGCLTQVNILSLLGYHGSSIKLKAIQLIKSGHVDFLGSNLKNHHPIELLMKGRYNSELKDLIAKYQFKNHLLL